MIDSIIEFLINAIEKELFNAMPEIQKSAIDNMDMIAHSIIEYFENKLLNESHNIHNSVEDDAVNHILPPSVD